MTNAKIVGYQVIADEDDVRIMANLAAYRVQSQRNQDAGMRYLDACAAASHATGDSTMRKAARDTLLAGKDAELAIRAAVSACTHTTQLIAS